MKLTHKHTIFACFVGYIVQAIINNFAPLLFLTFQDSFEIPLSKITLLVTFNFGVQLCVDLLAAAFADKIGYRTALIAANVFCSGGLILMAVLPPLLPDPFIGLMLSVMVYAIGGGLLETMVSPLVEACPTDNKESTMSLLHSFYCWGHVGVVLLSTAFFALFGIENWRILAVIWAVIPAANAVMFTAVPMATLVEDGKGMSLKELFKSRIFWAFMVMMLCSGASEQSVSQWSSTLAEKGLGISKTLGDLMGPMMFAILMGTSRAIFGKYAEKIGTQRAMVFSALLCITSYLCIALFPNPLVALIGCGVCGFSVGVMWPGSFSKAAVALPSGGTMMFALLALAGDLGCGGGPTFAGFMASLFGDDLKAGVLFAIVFPVLMTVMLLLNKRAKTK